MFVEFSFFSIFPVFFICFFCWCNSFSLIFKQNILVLYLVFIWTSCKPYYLFVPITSRICLINQSYSKNISVPFRPITTMSIFSSSNSTNWVTLWFPLLVPSTLSVSNSLGSGAVLIYLLSTISNLNLAPTLIWRILVLQSRFFKWKWLRVKTTRK